MLDGWGLAGGDGEAGFEDEFEGGLRGGAVVGFFGVGEVVVGDEAGVLLGGVVAHRAVAPAIIDAVLCPDFVYVFCHLFDERVQLRWERGVRCVDRLRHIFCFVHIF